MTITPIGASRYIYTYIMHNASIQSKKVNAYIPRAWPKMCWIANKGRHTLGTRTNGTQHDIPNKTHLREEGRGFKEYIAKWERLNL